MYLQWNNKLDWQREVLRKARLFAAVSTPQVEGGPLGHHRGAQSLLKQGGG